MQPAYSALILTDNKPQEVKACIWGGQATADLLANTEDLRYSFKTTSLACPFCGGLLEGDRSEGKEKKKPWEIQVDDLRHIEANPNCPAKKLQSLPKGTIIEKLVVCHIMTQTAIAEGRADSLHADPSIPKLHACWEGSDFELIKELAAEIHNEDALFNNADRDHGLPSGQVQRTFPATKPADKTGGWQETLKSLPRWSESHPNDPEAPKISGWILAGEENDPVVLCGYILPGDEPGEIPESYHVPIYEIHGPDTLTGKDPEAVPAYAEASLQSGPPEEPLQWREAATVKRLRKEEKNRRKKRIQEEIDRLPQEKIWEGFCTVQPEDLNPDPNPEKEEPPQLLAGYKSGADPKKWWLPGIGNPHAKIWIIGLYPSTEEIKRKAGPKILAGASGKELFRLVREAGLDPAKDVFFENLVKHFMPPKSKISAEVKMEQTWLLRRQLAHFKPERVICLGAETFKEIVGDKSFQGYRATWIDTTYPRGIPATNLEAPRWQGRTAGTFHPAGVLRPEGRHNLELFRHDFNELLLDKEKDDVTPTIKEIRTLEETKAWLENECATLENRGLDCIYTVDTEGVSLEVENDELLCLQIGRILGTFDPSTKWFEVEEVPKHVDIFVFRENLKPEVFDAEVFKAQNTQMGLFEEESLEEKPAGTPMPPVFSVANTEEERKQILETHGRKKKGRGLTLFSPFKRKVFLGNHEKEVGEILNTLALNKHCAGFGLTNANYDRIRLERFLDWDLSLAGVRRGIPYPLDTMLAEHVLDENGDLGLKPCLNKHFNWPRQSTELAKYAETHRLNDIANHLTHPGRKSEWSLYPWEILKPYAAKDAYGAAALLAKQMADITNQVKKYQFDRVESGNPNNLEAAFHIQCGAINGTYEMNKMGMPIGKKGMEILGELTNFYRNHEDRMIEEYQEAVFKLTGLRKANPASPEELSFVLFNETSPLRKMGIEPWKESGRNGRIWEEIPREERHNCTPSTDAESLEIIASNCQDPEIQNFLLRLSETKTILTIRSSFVADALDEKGKPTGKGLTGRINPHTLCMHTTYTPTLDTNRCRSVPNLSTFPKEEQEMVKKILGEPPPYKIREIVQAPPGAYLLNRDWTTAEVLGLGYLAQDTNMLAIVARMANGMDFHCKLAIQTYEKIRELFARIPLRQEPDTDWINTTFSEKTGKAIKELWAERWKSGKAAPFTEEETHKISKKIFKQERSNIKPVTFGVPYGREAPAIMKQLNREYYVNDTRDASGNLVTVTLEEAQAMIDSYKTGFSSAWNYLLAQAEHAKSHNFLRDHWGYIRHFPTGMNEGEITRKAYNYQIQHIVAVLMNQAMNDWVQERKRRNLKSYAYATLYDNIGWVVYEEELQEVWDLSMEIMTANRPVGPKISDLPILNEWHIPTEGELSQAWEGPTFDPSELGIQPHPELNLTGLEGKF